MRNVTATITYETIWDLTVSLAGRTPDNVPSKESTMLQTFFAAELEDLWRKEAWPELCDNLTEVTLTNNAFSKNLGAANEIGDILGLFTLDPRISPGWERIGAGKITEGNGQVYVDTLLQQVWVDYQLPCLDLLDPTLVGQANEATLMAATLPARFRMPLAFRGAARLLASEDPVLSTQYLKLAEVELQRQVARLGPQPWWRTEKLSRC